VALAIYASLLTFIFHYEDGIYFDGKICGLWDFETTKYYLKISKTWNEFFVERRLSRVVRFHPLVHHHQADGHDVLEGDEV